MNTQTVSNWFQVGASVAVLLSIGLLVLEMEQQRKLAYAQFIVDTVTARMQADLVVLGEDMGTVLAKSCFAPESLDESELTKLTKYFELRIAGITPVLETERISGVENPTWHRRLRRELIAIWRYEPGRIWWSEQRQQGWHPEFFEVAAQAEAEGLFESPKGCDEDALFKKYAG